MPSLERLWWGHRFVEVVDARIRLVGANAFALGGIEDPDTRRYRAMDGSKHREYIEAQYPIRIRVTEHEDAVRYFDHFEAVLKTSESVVLPFPRCATHGFAKLVDPIHHYVIAQRNSEPGSYKLMDLFGAGVVTRDQLIAGFQWFVDRYRFIPWYEIERNHTWVRPPPTDPVHIYSAVVREYEESGRSSLAKYAELARSLDEYGSLHQLPSSKLWSFPGCRLAEVKYLRSNNFAEFHSLIPLLEELAKAWRNIWFKARINQASGSSRARSLPTDLQSALNAEEAYMKQATELVA